MYFSAEERTAENVSREICKELQKAFGDKISDIKVDDMEDGRYQQFFPRFAIKFSAYDYFTIVFSVEGSSYGCSIGNADNRYVPLIRGRRYYTNEDFRECLAQISEEIALRIPDKFLRSRGWL